MWYDEVRAVIDQAAELLPEPPPAGDVSGRAGWEELTLDTGRCLASLLGADTALIHVLMADDAHASGRCRERRRLLLRVAALSARRTVKGEVIAAGESAAGLSLLPAARRLSR
jgi:hypothetical protein